MRILLALITPLLLSMILHGCKSAPDTSGEASSPGANAPMSDTRPELQGTWMLDTIKQGAEARDLIAGQRITLDFENDVMRANLGCNTATSTYSTTQDRIALTDMGITEMACEGDDAIALMEQEGMLMLMLEGVKRFRLQGDELTLQDDYDTMLTFTRAPLSSAP